MLVIRNCADIQQILRDWVCSHFSHHSWKHIKSKIGGTLIWEKIKKLRSSHHHAGERPIAGRACWLLHKVRYDGILIHGDNAASSGIGHLINAQRSCKMLLLMKREHA